MTIAQVEALVGELVLAADELTSASGGGADSWLSYVSKYLVWGGGADARRRLTQRVHEVIERHIGNRQPSASLVGLMDDDRQLRMCSAHNSEEEEQCLTDDPSKVVIITNRRPEPNQGNTRAQGTQELLLKFYGDRVDAHSGCWDVTPAVSLADAAVAVLASAAPDAFDMAALGKHQPNIVLACVPWLNGLCALLASQPHAGQRWRRTQSRPPLHSRTRRAVGGDAEGVAPLGAQIAALARFR
jgi:hypothetical protein